MARRKLGDVVVLLPGILGSVLQRGGKDIWAPTPGGVLRGLRTLGGSIRDLQLADNAPDDPQDGVVATRLMPDVHIIPGLWGIDGYSSISTMIKSTFDVVPGKTFIEFPYDWRLSNKVSAERLAAIALPALYEHRKINPAAKLVLIGHSMGGLVSRYFLECLDGARDTRVLITFGTPYRGSLNALDFLAHGISKKIGPFKFFDLTTFVRSMPSAYELLPIYPCVHSGSAGPTRVGDTNGLPTGLDRSRAHRAEHGFHRVIEAAVAARSDKSPYVIHPVVGLTQPTFQSARLIDGGIEMLRTFDGEDLGGDGTVPRVSATPIEFDGGFPDPAVYAAERHATLQNALSVQMQILGLLSPIENPVRFRGATSGLSLALDDLYNSGEEIAVTVVAGVRRPTLVATVSDADTGRRILGPLVLTPVDDQLTHTTELPPLTEGCYRITVAPVGADAADLSPVNGLFLVAGDQE